jgi:hypothetical protein
VPVRAPDSVKPISASVPSPQPKVHVAVRTVLEQAWQPLHVNELTKRLLDSRPWSSEGKTPAATVTASLPMRCREEPSTFGIG